jgi:L-glyceraldehyde 3-phosphate reductase
MRAMTYEAAPTRYETHPKTWFRRCGKSGLLLPAITLGCWHNFGTAESALGGKLSEPDFHENCRRLLFTSFDQGITHFDLANNYGPPPGRAEERVGRILKEDLAQYRDELIISTKAGYTMWPGPYGDWGSRKYLLASLDASLKRMGLEYVDIFYHHRPDPNTPLEETMGALEQAVKSGKALYAGVSNYKGGMLAEAVGVCEARGFAKPIIHQPRYSMFDRWIEADLLPVVDRLGIGVICFSPLAQGQLTDKYLAGIPADSRAASASPFLKTGQITPDKLEKVRRLNDLAKARGQTLAQMALAWVLRTPTVTSALIGASRPEQIAENVAAVNGTTFAADELEKIEAILKGG